MRAQLADESAEKSGLERLVGKAYAVILFERCWRLLVPPLLVLGFFICVSWTGLWLETPHWARSLGVLVFAIGLVLALSPLRKFRFPSRGEALARIDRVSRVGHRPAAALVDRLGNGAEDPATLALWSLHRRRARAAIASLRTGLPSPRVVDLDRYALRAAVVLGLVATGFIAGPEKYARVAAAFDWRFDGLSHGNYRLDAWIDPPGYTGKAPIVLNLHSATSDAVEKIEAPSGSIIIIRAAGGHPTIEATGPLIDAEKDKETAAKTPAPARPKGENETRLVLRGDALLTLGAAGERLAAFNLVAIPDQPPTIALTDAPKINARGSLTLAYKVADDYGVANGEAKFADPILPNGTPAKRSLVDPPRVALALPPAADPAGEAQTTADLSEHPWAGARVEMSLVARDEGGNEGKSAPIEIALPQKPLTKPLARALAEQRRNLILAPDDRARVSASLQALMVAPEAFDTSAGVYLGLWVAADRLGKASQDGDLIEIADFLWAMALRIENGDLSEAERDLRAAEQQLREALQRNAPEEEIRKLSENLRAAMDKFLREFAEQQQRRKGENEPSAGKGRNRAVSPKELQAMLDRMQDLARSGDAANAQKMLDRLQSILENLQMARPRKNNPAAQEMSRALGELDKMSKEQQDLRDETYRNTESQRRRQRRERGQMGLPGGFGNPLDQDESEDQDIESSDNTEAGQASEADLARRQKVLADRLEQLQKRLKQAGQGQSGLDDAKEAMGEAERALGQGASGGDDAVDAQGRAIEALREGAQKLAESLRGRGEMAGDGQGEGEDGDGEFGQGGGDPLGRPSGRERAFNPSARFDPLGAPAAQRAQRVLEELRRRLGEPSRPREEIEYLERLLRRY